MMCHQAAHPASTFTIPTAPGSEQEKATDGGTGYTGPFRHLLTQISEGITRTSVCLEKYERQSQEKNTLKGEG